MSDRYTYRVTSGPRIDRDCYDIYVLRYSIETDERWILRPGTTGGRDATWEPFPQYAAIDPTLEISGLELARLEPKDLDDVSAGLRKIGEALDRQKKRRESGHPLSSS